MLKHENAYPKLDFDLMEINLRKIRVFFLK